MIAVDGFERGMAMIGIVVGMMMATATSFESGNSLFTQCQSNADYDKVACMVYIAAVSDAIGQVGIKASCRPEAVTKGQLRDIVVKELAASPEVRHFSAASLITLVLKETFPCPK